MPNLSRRHLYGDHRPWLTPIMIPLHKYSIDLLLHSISRLSLFPMASSKNSPQLVSIHRTPHRSPCLRDILFNLFPSLVRVLLQLYGLQPNLLTATPLFASLLRRIIHCLHKWLYPLFLPTRLQLLQLQLFYPSHLCEPLVFTRILPHSNLAQLRKSKLSPSVALQ